jgi:hypothetical protein
MAPIIYAAEGQKILEQLWMETLEEFAMSPQDILREVSA